MGLIKSKLREWVLEPEEREALKRREVREENGEVWDKFDIEISACEACQELDLCDTHYHKAEDLVYQLKNE